MNGLTIVRVKLTPEAASNIFETAIDAGHTYGFGYWAELKGITRTSLNGITSIRLRERAEPNRTARINKADLERAIAKSMSAPHGITHGGLGEEYPDGPTCEAILQWAMFGEQVYG